MRPTGFSFACPHPTSSKDEAFERFYETAKADPSKIHNPFPQLAGLETFRQARTQPLIWTRYLPTTNPCCYGSQLSERLTFSHEMYHVASNHSPAKMLGRLLLLVLLCQFLWEHS
jgi:hypothetical protein